MLYKSCLAVINLARAILRVLKDIQEEKLEANVLYKGSEGHSREETRCECPL
jgi:hypothetical protein